MEAVALPRDRCDGAVATLVAAFWDYPETVHLLPDERCRRHVLPRYLASDCADSRRHASLLGVLVDDEVAGAAAWLPPPAYPISVGRQLEEAARLVPAVPWGIGAARRGWRGKAANRQRHPSEPHYFLRAVGVAPAHRGVGVGRALVTAGTDRADAASVGCYLTTAAEANVAFYEALGFVVQDRYRPTPEWPEVWSMWRESR